MPLPLDDGRTYKVLPGGSHLGAIVTVAELGNQVEQFGDQEPVTKRMLYLGFEFPEEKLDDGRPMTHYAVLNVSFHEKAKLVRWFRALGDKPARGWDIATWLGKPLLVIVESYENKEGQEKAKITGLAKPPKGAKLPDLHNELLCYCIGAGKPQDADGFDKLPEWVQKKILTGPDYKEELTEADIPF